MDVDNMVTDGNGRKANKKDKIIIPSIGGVIAPQTSPLASVPIEVLLHISSHLTTPEYGALRLTCKEIEGDLLGAFSKEFFTKRQFMFTEFSLQALLDISKSRFASSINQLIFGLEQPPKQPPIIVSQTPNDAPPDDLAKRNRMMIDYIKHAMFLNNGADFEMLAAAFEKLDNLKTVGIRDFNSRTRNRDYPNNTWKSRYFLFSFFKSSFIFMRYSSSVCKRRRSKMRCSALTDFVQRLWCYYKYVGNWLRCPRCQGLRPTQ